MTSHPYAIQPKALANNHHREAQSPSASAPHAASSNAVDLAPAPVTHCGNPMGG